MVLTSTFGDKFPTVKLVLKGGEERFGLLWTSSIIYFAFNCAVNFLNKTAPIFKDIDFLPKFELGIISSFFKLVAENL